MGAIFLSYARKDRPCAERLARVLEDAGHDVWWDRRLDGGEEFSAEIEAALDRADVVLVAWSKDAVGSRWVRDEASVGGDKGRLVPVSIDGVGPPMGFRQFHTLDLTDWNDARGDKRTADLLRSVELRLKGKPTPAPPAAAAKTNPALTPKRQLWASMALAILVLSGALSWFFFNLPTVQPPTRPTIALLPLTTSAADAELRNVAAQSQDSLAHMLQQSGVPVRLIASQPQNLRGEGDFLISGEVSRSVDKVVATIRLDEVTGGATVFSRRFEASGDDVRNLPERIGAQMASIMAWGGRLMMLDRKSPLDPALMARLMKALEPGTGGSYKYQDSLYVVGKAPNSAWANIAFAFSTPAVLGELPRADRPEAVATALRASEKAKALAPDFGDIHSVWCSLHSETRLAECEDRIRVGRRVDPDATFINSFLAKQLRQVGRFDEAAELIGLSYSHDPYWYTKIAWMLTLLESTGDSDGARKLYEQGLRWWPDRQPAFVQARLVGIVERGDLGAIRHVVEEIKDQANSSDGVDSGALLSALSAKSVGEAVRACPKTEDGWLNIACMLVFAHLGDQDKAYAIADKLCPNRLGRTPAETDRIWLDDPGARGPLSLMTSPGVAPMRRDPRYLDLARRTGLLAYWRSGRPPDFCVKQPEPICRQLLNRR